MPASPESYAAAWAPCQLAQPARPARSPSQLAPQRPIELLGEPEELDRAARRAPGRPFELPDELRGGRSSCSMRFPGGPSSCPSSKRSTCNPPCKNAYETHVRPAMPDEVFVQAGQKSFTDRLRSNAALALKEKLLPRASWERPTASREPSGDVLRRPGSISGMFWDVPRASRGVLRASWSVPKTPRAPPQGLWPSTLVVPRLPEVGITLRKMEIALPEVEIALPARPAARACDQGRYCCTTSSFGKTTSAISRSY